MNALIGQKVSITSKKPQTTRHRIVGIDTREAAQLIYVDTPGFQTRHRSLLNDRLNNAVREALGGVDVVVLVIDATRITEADRAVSRLLPDAVPVVCAVNKIDLVRDKALLLPLLAKVSQLFAFASVVPISAERGTQLEALRGEIVARLPQSPALRQDDRLQGWPWTQGTFSWVEPTAWALLALRRRQASGKGVEAARLTDAETLLKQMG